MIEASVIWAAKPPCLWEALIWSTKRWQYFTEYVAASREMGGIIRIHCSTGLQLLLFELEKKNRVLWELVKEYLRSILSSHSLLHLYMSVFNIYISLLNWIVLLALSSSMCLKDKRVSCNVDEVIYCIRVNLFVKTDGVISCELSKSFCIDNCQSCFYQTRLWLTIKVRLFSKI